VLHKIFQTALQSSNNGNMQTYSIIVTRDAEIKKKLALIHDNIKMETAPVILTFVCDWTRMSQWCKMRGAFKDGDECYNNLNAYLSGAFDAMVTAQAVASSAEACGLGICFLGSTIWEPKRLHELLEIPSGAHVVTSLMLGYPTENPSARARLDFQKIVHTEKYKRLSDHEVEAMYESREVEGWYRYKKLYGDSWIQKLKSHDCQNLAQVYTTLKYSGQDYRRWSQIQLESMRQQGFGRNDPLPKDAKPCAVCQKWSHCVDPQRFSGAGFSHTYVGECKAPMKS